MSLKRLLAAAAVAALAACSNTTTPVATGEFAAPSGLAVTSGGDRDLLFIANEGHDNLRALQLCTSDGGTFADGGKDTCPPQENLQFVPAPIRVFPAVVAEKIGAVAFYDTGTNEVVGQLANLGDSPYTARLLGTTATSARLAVSVFKGCKVALVEVPFDQPWNASLRGRAGKCE